MTRNKQRHGGDDVGHVAERMVAFAPWWMYFCDDSHVTKLLIQMRIGDNAATCNVRPKEIGK
jgi:hypothetical protein